MKMDFAEYLLVFTMFWKLSAGLRCFKCEAMSETDDEPLCEHFDFSSKYLKDCESSSMCYKRITITQFGTKIYERGCAHQTMDGYQERQNGKWRHVLKINEVYEEGCVESPGDEERVTHTEHCYCRGDLCNGVEDTRRSVFAMYKGTINSIASFLAISVYAIGVSMIGTLIM